MLDDFYFMKQVLIEVVKVGERGEVFVGVVVVCKEWIIVCVYNLIEILNDVIVYVEMQVIIVVVNVFGGKYLNECILYVIVEFCVMCVGVIVWV